MQKAISFVSGIILGSLVGATMAILLAPKSGDELRGEIQQRYIELKDEVQSAAEARRSELERQLEALRKPDKPT
jgi:gas vesicle protein